MITNKTLLATGAGLALVLAGAAAAALATDWGKGRWTGEGGKAKRGGSTGAYTRLVQFDADKDGRITRAEIDAGLTAQFSSADANADGKLDPLEFQRFNDARRAERKARLEAWRAKHDGDGAKRGGDGAKRPAFDQSRDGFDPIKYADWNLDGVISPDEFAGKTRSQAMRADRNGDGVIVTEEMKRGRGGKRGTDGSKAVGG